MVLSRLALGISWLPALVSCRQFNMWPYMDADAFAQAMMVDSDCLNAMNATLPCAEPYLTYAADVDFYWWGQDNLTELCTNECASALSTWTTSVINACGSQKVYVGGGFVKAESMPLVYAHGFELACLLSDSGNFCHLENQEWEGQEAISYSGDYCIYNDPEQDMPECDDPDFDPTLETDEMRRMTNLYSLDVLCSDCFLKVFKSRLESPFLPEVEYTTFLFEQWEDIQSACNTSIPLTTTSSTLFLGMATATATPTTPTSVPAQTTCAGQLAKTTDDDGTPLGCNQIAAMYNVSSGAVRMATDDPRCDVDMEVCLPLPCSIDRIGYTETCETLVEKYYTEANNLTLATFLRWNDNIIGFCNQPLGGQYVCMDPPGGAVSMAPPAYNPTGTTGYYTTATPPQPTSDGTTAACGLYYSVVAGDICQTICLRYGITFDQFRAMNPQLLEDCSNLWLGYSYCVYNVTAAPISQDGTCGSLSGNTVCEGSGFGNCCSSDGYCGSGNDYCANNVCQSGACIDDSLSVDGSCGPDNGNTVCPDGSCCSIYGYCGDGNDFCGPGNCYSGACDPDIGGISVDGSCGPSFAGNKTCTGSQFGACCSQYGYCGDGDDFCKGSNCYSGGCYS